MQTHEFRFNVDFLGADPPPCASICVSPRIKRLGLITFIPNVLEIPTIIAFEVKLFRIYNAASRPTAFPQPRPFLSFCATTMRRFFNKSTPAEQPKHDLKSIAIPLYLYPSPEAWTPIFALLDKNPTVHLNLIVNPASGPGGSVPDAAYIKHVAALNTYSNVTTYGYVHVSWAERQIQDVFEDISRWADWTAYSQADIHVDGIFVDEAPSKPEKISYMRDVWKHTQTAFKNSAVVWTNPGVEVASCFYDYADLVNAFENTSDYWFKERCEGRVPGHLRTKSSVMLHSFHESGDRLDVVLHRLSKAGYHTVLLTESSDYTALPLRLLTKVQAVDAK